MKTAVKILKRVVTLAIVAGIGYFGWTYYQARNAEDEASSLGDVPSQAARVRDITVTVSATGVLRPVKIIQVKSKASGEILDMPVELGDYVRAGDLIAQVDTRITEQDLDQANADLASAETRMQVSERQWQRAQEMQKQDLVSAQDLDTSEQNYATARAQLLRAQAEVQKAQERLTDATVRAPSSGTIIAKNVEEGTIITSSTNNVSGGVALVEMADLSRLEIRTLVDEIDIGRVKAGLPVESTVEAYPDKRFQGQVLKIEPLAVVEQQVTTFPVISFIDNSEGLLKIGMNADVEIVIHRRPGVLTVPNEGVRDMNEAAVVAELLSIPFDREALESGRANYAASQMPGRSDSGAAFAATAAPGDAQAAPATGGDGQEGEVAEADDDAPVDFSKMRGMSSEERRKFMEGLTDKQREQLEQQRARFSAGRGGSSGGMGGAQAARPGGQPAGGMPQMGGGDEGGRSTPSVGMDAFGIGAAPEAAVVFVVDEMGKITPVRIMTGVRDWEFTEVISGLPEGAKVVLLPSTSLLQSQQAMRDRFRSFSSVPGTGGSGGMRGPR